MRIHVLVLLSTLALSAPVGARPLMLAKGGVAKVDGPPKVAKVDKLAAYRDSRKEVEGFIRSAGPEAVNTRTGAIRNHPDRRFGNALKGFGAGLMAFSVASSVGIAAVATQNPGLQLFAAGLGVGGGAVGSYALYSGMKLASDIKKKADTMALAVAAKFGHKPNAADKARWKAAGEIE